jgi:hypothetical protein
VVTVRGQYMVFSESFWAQWMYQRKCEHMETRVQQCEQQIIFLYSVRNGFECELRTNKVHVLVLSSINVNRNRKEAGSTSACIRKHKVENKASLLRNSVYQVFSLPSATTKHLVGTIYQLLY